MEWHTAPADSVLSELKTSRAGLTAGEARLRMERYGPNELPQAPPVPAWRIFGRQFANLLVAILVVAAAVSLLVLEDGLLDAGVILAIVILNALFGFVQEYRAERTVEALKKLAAPVTTVLRDGKPVEVASRLIVPGDVILLEEGVRIPADCRVLDSIDFHADEAILTGESQPVRKQAEAVAAAELADRKDMVYLGTLATFGRATAVVTATGAGTEVGKISKLVEDAKEERTPLQQELSVFGRRLGFLIIGICVLVAVVGILRAGPLQGLPITQALVAQMAITGIALAVAAIPEGLPAVVTITLALGLQRLAKRNALMRRLAAVETLGSTSVICSDKTGTLTKNEMTVTAIWHSGTEIAVTGTGYEPRGTFLIAGKEIVPERDRQLMEILKASALCNNAALKAPNPVGDEAAGIIGDPTEGALVVAAAKAMNVEALKIARPRLAEIPFSGARKMMSVACSGPRGEAARVYVKGAPEVVLERCTHVLRAGREMPLSAPERKKALEANHALTLRALRVLAVAERAYTNRAEMETKLVFLGLVGMIDPPREEVKEDLARCRAAGIKVVVITGDHKNTALAISQQLGVTADLGPEHVLTGEELAGMSEPQLEAAVERTVIYARVDPEHKLKIVQALKKKGQVVAMLGDGVNDAPAIKHADIGVAMGIKGTDVAKEAAQMILRDDSFRAVVAAVHEGRAIYDNIRKFILYLLSSNLGEVAILFLALLIGFTDPATGLFLLPVTALQLLWINLLTDGLPALAMGVDPAAADVMERKPRPRSSRLLNRHLFQDMSLTAGIMAAGVLVLFWMNLAEGARLATTVAFTGIVVFELFNVQSVRRKFGTPLLENKKVLLAVAASFALQLAVVYAPPLQAAFDTVGLGLVDWAEILAVSVVGFLARLALLKRERAP